MPDGQPQVTPVWGLLENGNLKINTAIGRQKDKNMRERPQATVLLVDPENGQNWIEVRCRVANRTTDGADAEIDALAKKYLNQDTYPWRNPGGDAGQLHAGAGQGHPRLIPKPKSIAALHGPSGRPGSSFPDGR